MFPFLLQLKHDYAAVANGMHQCPLCVISGLSSRHRSVSALHPKADVHLGSGEVFSSGFAYFHRRVCVCVWNRYMYISYRGTD
jgi:hypothetical protein